VLKTLLDRKLIQTAGRKNVVGRPILYRTSKEFLMQFGLKDLSELPTLKEFEELRRLAAGDEPENAAPGAAGLVPEGAGVEPETTSVESEVEAEVRPVGPEPEAAVAVEPAAGQPEAEAAPPDADAVPQPEAEAAQPEADAAPKATEGQDA